jgi:hypothetical protein
LLQPLKVPQLEPLKVPHMTLRMTPTDDLIAGYRENPKHCGPRRLRPARLERDAR